MAAVSGQMTTFNLPNYHGELFTVSPVETPFLAAIGNLNGAKASRNTEFEWQTIDRRAGAVNNVVVEGATAPDGVARTRTNASNITEIHQSAVEISYTKLATNGATFNGLNEVPQWDDQLVDELNLQTHAELQSMALDIEQSFLQGVYNKPADNTGKRQTRGLLTAITTNVTDHSNAGTPAAIDASTVDNHLLTMHANGGLVNVGSTVLMAHPKQALALSKAYAADSSLSAPVRDRNIAGVDYKQIVTIFGTFPVVMNRWLPQDQVVVVDLSVCYPVFVNIPGKGLLFVEELAKTGASQKFQLYGEIGLEYGPELYHGKITGLA